MEWGFRKTIGTSRTSFRYLHPSTDYRLRQAHFAVTIRVESVIVHMPIYEYRCADCKRRVSLLYPDVFGSRCRHADLSELLPPRTCLGWSRACS